MVSKIDPTSLQESVPASKAELRRNLEAAKAELEHGGFYLPPGPGGLPRTVRAKLAEGLVSVKDCGALGDGSGATVAEWLAGGRHDRSYADLGAVQADYPEATTLDATIDSIALMRAINQALAEGNDVVIPHGTYVIDPAAQRIEVTLSDGGRLSIVGLGRNSVIKRKDGTSTSNFMRMMYLRTGAGGFDYLELRDFTIDSNARANPVPSGDDWAFEHSADLFFETTVSEPLGCARFANLYCIDAMADHISIGNEEGQGTTVGCAIFDQIVARHRTRPRADIIVYNGCELALMSNLDVQRIEAEFNTAPAQKVQVHATNVRTDVLDLAGSRDSGRTFYFNGLNLDVPVEFLLYGLSARISASKVKLREDARILNVGDVTLIDTEVLLPYDAQEQEVVPISFQHDEGAVGARVRFVRCRFRADAGPEAGAIAGYAVGPGSAVSAEGQELPEVTFEQCEFDHRLEGCINAYRAGIWRSKECRFACRGTPLRVATSESYLQHYTSDNDDFAQIAGPPFVLGSGEAGTENCRLVLCHALTTQPSTAFAVESSGWQEVVLESSRLVLIDQGPPRGGGVAGDRARLRRPVAGAGLEWLCVASDPEAASWVEVVRVEG